MITERSRFRAGSCTLYRSRPISELFLRNILYESHKTILIMYRPIEASTSLPSPRPRAYPRHLAPLPSRGGGNLIIRIFKGVGNLIPVCLIRGGEFELHPRFHVESLARWAVMGDAVLDDFRGKDCAFVANWLQGLCRIWRYLNWIQALRSFEYMNVLSCVYSELQYLYRRFNTTIKSSTEVHYFDLPHVC